MTSNHVDDRMASLCFSASHSLAENTIKRLLELQLQQASFGDCPLYQSHR